MSDENDYHRTANALVRRLIPSCVAVASYVCTPVERSGSAILRWPRRPLSDSAGFWTLTSEFSEVRHPALDGLDHFLRRSSACLGLWQREQPPSRTRTRQSGSFASALQSSCRLTMNKVGR